MVYQLSSWSMNYWAIVRIGSNSAGDFILISPFSMVRISHIRAHRRRDTWQAPNHIRPIRKCRDVFGTEESLESETKTIFLTVGIRVFCWMGGGGRGDGASESRAYAIEDVWPDAQYARGQPAWVIAPIPARPWNINKDLCVRCVVGGIRYDNLMK